MGRRALPPRSGGGQGRTYRPLGDEPRKTVSHNVYTEKKVLIFQQSDFFEKKFLF